MVLRHKVHVWCCWWCRGSPPSLPCTGYWVIFHTQHISCPPNSGRKASSFDLQASIYSRWHCHVSEWKWLELWRWFMGVKLRVGSIFLYKGHLLFLILNFLYFSAPEEEGDPRSGLACSQGGGDSSCASYSPTVKLLYSHRWATPPPAGRRILSPLLGAN